MRKFAWIALAAVCPSAFGWGVEGHALIVRIAEAQLTARARDQITAILGPGETMVSVASWADEVRRTRPETGPWHYIDIPIGARTWTWRGTVRRAIAYLRRIRRSPKAVADAVHTAGERREALMFLIHFRGRHAPAAALLRQPGQGRQLP